MEMLKFELVFSCLLVHSEQPAQITPRQGDRAFVGVDLLTLIILLLELVATRCYEAKPRRLSYLLSTTPLVLSVSSILGRLINNHSPNRCLTCPCWSLHLGSSHKLSHHFIHYAISVSIDSVPRVRIHVCVYCTKDSIVTTSLLLKKNDHLKTRRILFFLVLTKQKEQPLLNHEIHLIYK